MRIVLIGDVHAYRLAMWPWDLLSKRLLGQANLWLNRRHHFDMSRIGAMIEHVCSLEPNLLLLSGDLTTTATAGEFALARYLLRPLLEAFDTFIVPGNHDRYTFTAARTRRFEQHFGDHTATRWPHHRKLAANVHLVGLDPTRPNLITDRGRLGDDQLGRLRQLLGTLPAGDPLIVLSHYTLGMPPDEKPEADRHALIDRHALLDALRGDRPTLYLHGHVHRPTCRRHDRATNIVAVNAGAPLMTSPRWPCGQGVWQIDIADVPTATEADGPPWSLVHHTPTPAGLWYSAPVAIPDQPGQAEA